MTARARKVLRRSACVLFVAIAVCACVGHAEPAAPLQQIRAEASSTHIAAGTTLTLAVRQALSGLAAGSRVNGLGLRLHFDGRRLAFLGFDEVYASGKLGEDSAAHADTDDVDHDPDTDSVVQLAWVDLRGHWSQDAPSPLLLFKARFKVLPGAPGHTTLRFSSTGGATPLQFDAVPVTLELR